MVHIEGLGDFEGYPNRNSLPYIETYGIPTTKGMFRGTLRNVGWCPTMKKLGELGLFSDEERDDLEGLTFKELTARLVGSSGENLKADLAAFLGIEADSLVMSNLEWLGLLSDDPLPAGQRTLLDVLAARMLEKMSYEPGERDMIILQHEILAQYPDRMVTPSRLAFTCAPSRRYPLHRFHPPANSFNHYPVAKRFCPAQPDISLRPAGETRIVSAGSDFDLYLGDLVLHLPYHSKCGATASGASPPPVAA